MTEFIGMFVPQCNLRPRRIAYLVRSGNQAQLLKAMQYAASEWGGITQPVIPFTAKRGISPGYRELCDLFQPEVFIDYAGVPSSLQQELQSTYGASIVDEARLKYAEPGLHVLAPISRDNHDNQLDLPADSASLIQTAVLGSIWDSDENAWREAGFVPNLVSSVVEMFYAQIRGTAEIGLTLAQLPIFELQGGMPGIIAFCFRRPSLGQLLWFWNMRALSAPALGRQVFLIDPAVFHDPNLATHLRETALRKETTTPDLVLIGKDPAEMRRLGEEAGFALIPPGSKLGWRLAATKERDLGEEPLTFAVNLHPGLILGGRRFAGIQSQQAVTVTSPESTLHVTLPARFQRNFGGFVRFEFRGIEPLEWPHHPSVARLINNDATYSSYGIGVVTSPADRYQFPLRVPQSAQVLGAILEDRGWVWKPSDKGVYAQALLDSLSGIEAVGAIASPRALQVIRSLTSMSRPKAEQAIRGALGSRIDNDLLRETLDRVLPALVPRWRSLEEIAGDVGARKQDTLRILEQMLAERLVLRGFRFKCLICSLSANLPLGREADRITCEGCGSRNLLRGPETREPMIVYTLNTLLDRVMDQDCLGHLLTERWITKLGRGVWFVPGADVSDQANGVSREVDVLGLSHTELLVGEVKSSARAFKPEVVKSVGELATALGATTAVLAALDEWPRKARDRTEKQIAARGLKAMIGSGAQLLTD